MKPMWDARQRASSPSDIRSILTPPTSISPASARSMPPSRLSKVVLPDPDGPITATKSPRGIARLRWSKMVMVSLPLVNRLHRPARPTIESPGDELLGDKLLGDNMGAALGRCGGIGPYHGGIGGAVFQERHLDRHVRQDARVLRVHADADLDGRLLAIGGRNDGDDGAGDDPVLVGIEPGLDAGAGMQPANRSLIDVNLD